MNRSIPSTFGIWSARAAFTCLAIILGSLPALGQRDITIFPQFASGGGWATDIFLCNQGTSAVAGITLSFFGDDGLPMSVETSQGTIMTLDMSLGPGATRVIRAPSTGSGRTGYVLLFTPAGSSVRATELFRLEQGGRIAAELGVPQQTAFTSYSFPVEVDSSKRLNTGMAFANAPSGMIMGGQTIVINLVNPDGTLRSQASLALAIAAHRSLFLTDADLFPWLDKFTGTASVSGAFPFGALALRQDGDAFGAVSIDTGPVLAPFGLTGSPSSEVEPNDSATQAQYLRGPQQITGRIGSAGDMDFFQFSGKKGDVVTAVVDTQGTGSSLDSVLSLQKLDGTVVSQNNDNGLIRSRDSFLQLALPADGTYVLRVSDAAGTGSLSHTYRLQASVPVSSPPPPPPTSIVPSDGMYSGLTSQGKTIDFVVSGGKVTYLLVEFLVGTGNCWYNLRTWDKSFPIENGQFLATSSLYTIQGTFSSGRTATGTLEITVKNAGDCSGTAKATWSASLR